MSRPRTTPLLPATVAVLVLALTGCGSGTDDRAGASESSGESPTSDGAAEPSAPAAATELTVDGGEGAGRCMAPSAEALATSTTAFEGTVVALEDGTATLSADRWFAGEESEEVTVTAPDADLRALLSAVELEVGKTYLVSATGDQLSLCGFTAEKTPDLEALYVEAFGS